MNNLYLNQLVLVGAGGFIGSVLRFMISGWTQRLAVWSVFPYGTLVVNVLGCLLIGVLGGLAEFRQVLEPGHRLFLMIGVLGGFTTFSTFAYETLALLRDGEALRAGANVVASVSLSMIFVWLGYALGNR